VPLSEALALYSRLRYHGGIEAPQGDDSLPAAILTVW
jgi:hypothetical protein